MPDPLSRPCTAFDGVRRIASGALVDVALAAKAALARNPTGPLLTFDDATGAVIDLDLRGGTAEIVSRLLEEAKGAQRPAGPSGQDDAEENAPSRGRGRPRLGVVAREVTLLPRHWEWLATQRGGASHALRRLVDEARRADGGRSQSRAAQEAAYRFMSAMAGDLPGFEEASRALFAGDRERFAEHSAAWPADIQTHARKLAWERAAETPRP
ncbi:DUF2239 family protein [Roseomonas hellenica]|uniref:DUF2239 family protein n=1 Tax=Plastoroseomonas hellenica TaxID=2687306 RepID=A0ABS5EUQ4_9PROT|nr:DUF2239 family protein [Plastoroseomonas hellenica]MBR0664023.1 DUF2239 family protein [Plastoroseomonas hellenica]